ncbi:TolC family protein [Solitalea sp. MAHUQ-68]|uniref:TolC family protein n=1 Tax=Solitalea agri TaxID=2953739 RepID=A0A9X2F080_9SPHI|nr:TolC family protein [Solitalea agri]MCO4291831.1 TolC family protein [Solitalea agri]
MKKPIFLFITSSILLFNKAQAQEKFTLEQCVNYALEHNLSIKQAKFAQSVSEVNYSQSKFDLAPTVNGNISQLNNFGRSVNQVTYEYANTTTNNLNYGLSANWNLFSGLQRVNSIKQAKYSLMANQSNVEKTIQDVSLNVVTQFLATLFNEEQVNNLTNQLKVSQEQAEMAKKKADVGSITEADYLQFKAQVAIDETNLTSAQNQFEISTLELKQLLSLEPQQAFSIQRPSENALKASNLQYDANYVYNEAVKINPAIKISEYQKLSYEKLVSMARGAYYPTLSMNANMGSYYSWQFEVPDDPNNPNGSKHRPSFSDQYDSFLGKSLNFSLNIPIFNGLQSRNNVKKAKIDYENAKASEELAKNVLNKTIAQSVADLRAAEKKYASAQSSFESLKKAYEYSQKRFDVGLINSLDLNISKNNYSKSESEALQAKYDMIFKSKVIDYYLGKPLTL